MSRLCSLVTSLSSALVVARRCAPQPHPQLSKASRETESSKAFSPTTTDNGAPSPAAKFLLERKLNCLAHYNFAVVKHDYTFSIIQAVFDTFLPKKASLQGIFNTELLYGDFRQ